VFSGTIGCFCLLILLLLCCFWRKREKERKETAGKCQFCCVTLLCLVNVGLIGCFMAYAVLSFLNPQYKNLMLFIEGKCFQNPSLLLAITKADIYVQESFAFCFQQVIMMAFISCIYILLNLFLCCCLSKSAEQNRKKREREAGPKIVEQ